MAGSVRKIMAYLGLVDDEYDDYEELSERSRPIGTRPPQARRPQRDEYDEYDDYDRPPRRPQQPRTNSTDQPGGATISRIKPVREDGTTADTLDRRPAPRPAPAPVEHTKVSTVSPSTFGQAKEIGDEIRRGNPVIVNLQQADRDLQRRMIDFCSGIAYALQCSMERVADQVFLLSPTDVTVSAEERARLKARGFNDR